MEPFTAVAVGSQVLSGVAGFKGNRAAARQSRQIAEYNAQLAENEAVLLARQKRESEARVRQNGRRLYGTAVTAAAPQHQKSNKCQNQKQRHRIPFKQIIIHKLCKIP